MKRTKQPSSSGSRKEQFDCPLRVVAFNTEEGWAGDVTKETATKLLDLNQNGLALGAVARDFVERITGESATVAV